jgi:hypothetical protein
MLLLARGCQKLARPWQAFSPLPLLDRQAQDSHCQARQSHFRLLSTRSCQKLAQQWQALSQPLLRDHQVQDSLQESIRSGERLPLLWGTIGVGPQQWLLTEQLHACH